MATEATEAAAAAAAALRFGFEKRGLERIVSITQVGNDASERIMSKTGMHHESRSPPKPLISTCIARSSRIAVGRSPSSG
ncbi:GNAT family N-acetyltransferase [Streptomyces chattanoogensis]|uniref:GNAT family N-acetyltransferase n=1 Tax=Streptomyces chattanoogensis TaxID=66876 RepID=UPI0036BE01C4